MIFQLKYNDKPQLFYQKLRNWTLQGIVYVLLTPTTNIKEYSD